MTSGSWCNPAAKAVRIGHLVLLRVVGFWGVAKVPKLPLAVGDEETSFHFEGRMRCDWCQQLQPSDPVDQTGAPRTVSVVLIEGQLKL